MIRVNRAVAQMEKPIKTAKLTKANLEELKYQLKESLDNVNKKFDSNSLNLSELVFGFKERIHSEAENQAWKDLIE